MVVGKLPILTHSVKTYNKLLFESQERCSFDFRPFSYFLFKWLIVGLCGFSFVVLIFFKLVDFFLELCSLLTGLNPVRNSLLESFIGET